MSDVHAAREQHELEAQLRATGTWRPMDAAPRDGTHVLLSIEGGAVEGWWDTGYKSDGEWLLHEFNWYGCGCCGFTHLEEPKGWLPLPGAA